MKQVSSETIARTVILILALLNQILAVVGKGTIELTDDQIYQVVSLLFTIASTGAAWWKNNSFTQPAIKADTILKEMKTNG